MKDQPKPSPWFDNIRWGEAFLYVAGTAIAAGGAVIQTGGTWEQARTAATAAALIAAGAFLRNPKTLEWETGNKPAQPTEPTQEINPNV